MITQIQAWIDDEELVQLKRVVDSTFVTEAALTTEFEDLTKAMTGAKHAVAVTNGTAALYCGLKALGVGPGDEVIVPDLTFIATANAAVMAGATPVFCEVKADTFCIDVSWAERLVTPRTKAIIPVHLYGQAAPMDEVAAFAASYDLKVLEDGAQGVGVSFQGKHVGTFGDIGILSYFGNKTITCGQGGVVLTDDDKLAEKIYRLKNHGRASRGLFVHEEIGFNFAFTEMQAAIGIAQMGKLGRIVERKRQIHDRYAAELAGISAFQECFIDPRSSPVFWFTSYLADDAEKLATHLWDAGIQTRRFFYPLHQQPCYQGVFTSQHAFPIAEDVYRRGISLPSSYHLTEDEQGQVIDAIRAYYRKG